MVDPYLEFIEELEYEKANGLEIGTALRERAALLPERAATAVLLYKEVQLALLSHENGLSTDPELDIPESELPLWESVASLTLDLVASEIRLNSMQSALIKLLQAYELI